MTTCGQPAAVLCAGSGWCSTSALASRARRGSSTAVQYASVGPVQRAARAAPARRAPRGVRGLDDVDAEVAERARDALEVHAGAAVAAQRERRVDEDADGRALYVP